MLLRTRYSTMIKRNDCEGFCAEIASDFTTEGGDKCIENWGSEGSEGAEKCFQKEIQYFF